MQFFGGNKHYVTMSWNFKVLVQFAKRFMGIWVLDSKTPGPNTLVKSEHMAMGPGQSDPGTQLFCIHDIELGLRQLDPELILQL